MTEKPSTRFLPYVWAGATIGALAAAAWFLPPTGAPGTGSEFYRVALFIALMGVVSYWIFTGKFPAGRRESMNRTVMARMEAFESKPAQELVVLTRDSDPATRAAAAGALSDVEEALAPDLRRAVARRLVELLDDANAVVVSWATGTLETYASDLPENDVALLARRMTAVAFDEHASSDLRNSALYALGALVPRLAPGEPEELLRRLTRLTTSEDSDVQEGVAVCLGGFRAPPLNVRALSLLIPFAEHAEGSAMWAAFASLGAMAPRLPPAERARAGALLLGASTGAGSADPSDAIQAMVAAAKGIDDDTSHALIGRLLELLHGSDETMAREAAEALREIGAPLGESEAQRVKELTSQDDE